MEFLNNLPEWAGTVPQWGMLAAIVVALINLVTPWRAQDQANMAKVNEVLNKRVDELQKRLDECEANCEARDATIIGMHKQNVAQQIGFARILMDQMGNENPELQQMLRSLESIQIALEAKEARNA